MTELEKVQEFVRKGYTYEPETGIIRNSRGAITNNKNISGYAKITTSLLPDETGHRQVLQVYSHRFAWYCFYGELPKLTIDHINSNRSDNRIFNLRELSQGDNTAVRIGRGWIAYKSKKGIRYHAQIRMDGATKFLGSFSTPDAAKAAYLEQKLKVLEKVGKTLYKKNNI